MDSLVRVGVTNNFNCTDAEFRQVDGFSIVRSDCGFFINSNIKTPCLLNINRHDYKAVVSINPDVTVDDQLVERFYRLDPKKIAYVRVKYVPDNASIMQLIERLAGDGYTVMLTVMRFLSNRTVTQYADKSKYEYSCTWFRLREEYIQALESAIEGLESVYICDRKGLGCGGCGQCARLVAGLEIPVSTVNLSASGLCPYSCVDCYAKKMQHFLISQEKRPIKYDVIHGNAKQKGITSHIRANKAKIGLAA